MTDLLKAALAMVTEGMSVPFPGIIFLLTWGSINSPSIGEGAAVSLLLAFSYTAGSFFPYFIGEKLGNRAAALFGKKINNAFIRGQNFMKKYGVIAVAISRPFGWGNYISYIAGAAEVDKKTYSALTFAGIYPWCLVMVLLGRKFRGNIAAVMEFINDISVYIYIIVFTAALIFALTRYRRYVKLKR